MRAASEPEVPPEFAQALRELGLVGTGAVTGTPLTGGVSSDIWRIEERLGGRARFAGTVTVGRSARY